MLLMCCLFLSSGVDGNTSALAFTTFIAVFVSGLHTSTCIFSVCQQDDMHSQLARSAACAVLLVLIATFP